MTPGYRGSEDISDRVVFTAAAGESNDITATVSGPALAIEDTGAPITAGEGCEQVAPHDVSCHTRYNPPDGAIYAGDGNDTVRLVSAPNTRSPLAAYGGSGDDALFAADTGSYLDGGAGSDVLTGASGADTLIGGAGSDVLLGGAGADLLTGDGKGSAPARDDIDGGPGSDYVLYDGRSTPVTVDLRRVGGNGAAGEDDQLRNIENATGGSGSDVLIGDERANSLYGDGGGTSAPTNQHDLLVGLGGDDHLTGGAGTNVLAGGAGDDGLEGGGGPDRFSGGPGNDVIDLHPEATKISPSVRCGPGRDLVEDPLHHEVIPAGCETVQLDGPVVSTHLERLGPALVGVDFVEEPDPSIIEPCKVAADLYGPIGRRARRAVLLGSGAVRLRLRHHQRVHVRLTPSGEQLLRSGHREKVLLVMAHLNTCHESPVFSPRGLLGFTLVY